MSTVFNRWFRFTAKKQQIHAFQVSVTRELERRTSVGSQGFPGIHRQTESKKVLRRKHSRESEVMRFVNFIREVFGFGSDVKVYRINAVTK